MKKGFTLFEVLVSLAIFLPVLFVMFSVATATVTLWQRGISHNDRRQAALHAFSKMSRDMRFATTEPNPHKAPFWKLNPAGISAQYFNPQAMFIQKESRWIGYFVQWVAGRPMLCRAKAAWGQRLDDGALSILAPADKASAYQGFLAENVLGIWIQPLDSKGAPIDAPAGTFDAENGYKATAKDYRPKWEPPGSVKKDEETGEETIRTTWELDGFTYEGEKEYTLSVPSAARIVIVVIDARTAAKLAGSERPGERATNDAMSDAKAFIAGLPRHIRQGAEAFQTTIEVISKPR